MLFLGRADIHTASLDFLVLVNSVFSLSLLVFKPKRIIQLTFRERLRTLLIERLVLSGAISWFYRLTIRDFFLSTDKLVFQWVVLLLLVNALLLLIHLACFSSFSLLALRRLTDFLLTLSGCADRVMSFILSLFVVLDWHLGGRPSNRHLLLRLFKLSIRVWGNKMSVSRTDRAGTFSQSGLGLRLHGRIEKRFCRWGFYIL